VGRRTRAQPPDHRAYLWIRALASGAWRPKVRGGLGFFSGCARKPRLLRSPCKRGLAELPIDTKPPAGASLDGLQRAS